MHLLIEFSLFCFTSCNNQTCVYYSNRGEKLFQQRKYDKAVLCYSKAIDCCSSKIELYYFRAETYLCLKNYYLALRDINYVINSDFNYQNAHLVRGIIYRNTLQYEKALDDFSYELRTIVR